VRWSVVGDVFLFCFMDMRHLVSSCVFPSVRHKPILYRNDCKKRAGFWHGVASFTLSHIVLCSNEIRVPPKIRVLPSGTLPNILDLENFATASRSCCQQNSSTVEFVDHIYDNE